MDSIFRKYLFLVAVALLVSSCGERQLHDENTYSTWGLDLSKHQQHVNWDKVLADEPPHFVFLKATEGTLIVDPTYAQHLKELRDRNILCGAYHFFGHRTSGKEQAQNFIKTARLRKGDLYPVLDIERHRFFKDENKMVQEVQAFCREIKRYYGTNPILYCSSEFYKRYLSAHFDATHYTLWIADYSKHPPFDWKFWQHTETHRMNGITGNVDRNVFDGSVDDLEKLTLK